MTKFSSFKKQQKLFENWRRYTNESFRPYDAGYQTTDDERRADNRRKQKAAEEYAEKMRIARDDEVYQSAQWEKYNSSYLRHQANADLDSPLEVYKLTEEEGEEAMGTEADIDGAEHDPRDTDKEIDLQVAKGLKKQGYPVKEDEEMPSAEERRRELALLKKPSTDVSDKPANPSKWRVKNHPVKVAGGPSSAPNWAAGNLELEIPKKENKNEKA